MSLKQKAVSGMKWTTMSMVVITGLQFLKTIILGRILGPAVFGLLGMITVVIGLANAFGDMGISNAIIHRQDATKNQLSSLYWLNIFSGFFVFLIVFACTPLIVNFYREPQIRIPLYWLSLSFIIMPFGLQFKMLLQKNLEFNGIAIIEIISVFIDIIIAIILALNNFGIFSLVGSQLVGITIKTLFYMAIGWKNYKPAFHFQRNDLKGYLSFGLYQMGERITNYISTNLDYILIGKFLGAAPLGIYTLAYHLVVVPLTKINPIITNVMFPVFAKIQDDPSRLSKGYLKVISLVALISFPLLTGLAVVSPALIPLLWGDKWLLAIPLIQILSLMGILKAVGNPMGSLLLAKGRADIGFKYNLGILLIYLAVFLYLVKSGVIYIAIAHVVIPFILLPISLLILYHQINIRPGEYFSVQTYPFLGSLLMGIVMYILYPVISRLITVKPVSLAIVILIGSAVFIGFNLVFNKVLIKEMINTIRAKKGEIVECQA